MVTTSMIGLLGNSFCAKAGMVVSVNVQATNEVSAARAARRCHWGMMGCLR
jgi:hypothetical protein